jgi:hypothetical protein
MKSIVGAVILTLCCCALTTLTIGVCVYRGFEELFVAIRMLPEPEPYIAPVEEEGEPVFGRLLSQLPASHNEPPFEARRFQSPERVVADEPSRSEAEDEPSRSDVPSMTSTGFNDSWGGWTGRPYFGGWGPSGPSQDLDP